jgi:hypothetical protein
MTQPQRVAKTQKDEPLSRRNVGWGRFVKDRKSHLTEHLSSALIQRGDFGEGHPVSSQEQNYPISSKASLQHNKLIELCSQKGYYR